MNIVVLGASDNPMRYSNLAVKRLLKAGHYVFPVGTKPAIIEGLFVRTSDSPIENIDIITLYVGARHQPYWYNFILGTKPRKIIFNPGSENPELEELALKMGIITEEACTLALIHQDALMV
jgi:uncharacterized protein